MSCVGHYVFLRTHSWRSMSYYRAMKTSHCAQFFLAAVAVAIVGVGCATNPAAPPPPPHCSLDRCPPATPTPPTYLYLSQGSIYTLPLSNASAAVRTFSATGLGMAFDAAQRLFVANPADGTVSVFNHPIGSGATPSFVLSTGLAGAYDVAVDSAGDLFVTGHTLHHFCFFHFCGSFPQNTIKVFTAPVSSSSTASATYAGADFRRMQGAAVDSSGNLWASDSVSLYEFTPPVTGTSAPALSIAEAGIGIRFDNAGNMYVCTANGVDVFAPPFGNSMSKAYTINAPAASYVAFDQLNNAYVTTTNGTVLMFRGGASGATAPLLTMNIPSGAIAGIAIGQ